MAPARPPRRLRHRLFFAFLAFALLPTLLLGWIAYRTIDASLELWRTPAVSRALEGSVTVARQFLQSQRPVLDDSLDSLLAGGGPVTRERLASSLIEALGVSESSRPSSIHWTAQPGHVQLEALLERRLEALNHDTLVVSGPEHLALIRVRGARRWIALSPLPDEVRGPLAEILKARSLYEELDDYRAVTRRSLGLAALGLLVLVLLVAWVLASRTAQRITGPLESLTLAMAAFSRGERAAPVASGEAEVRELSAAFDSMQSDLEVSRRELARAERAAAWREVARRIAHEIKNPLTPIRLAAHRLKALEPQLPEPERARLMESLDAIDQEVETLRRMADTFSKFSRLPEPDCRPAALLPIVKSVAEMYDEGSMGLRYEVDAALRASVDEGQIRQALHNLIQNASDATQGHGPVRVVGQSETREGRLGATLIVEDGGPGFGPEALRRAGEPYFTEKTHGTGLGLAMVRRIIEGHAGALTLANSDRGGACVKIWLPSEAAK